MHPFAPYVLHSYYRATGWNEDNLYSNLTRSSNAILDFSVPRGLHLSVSKSPNAFFNTSYTMNALPSLNGSVGYIFSSRELDIKNSSDVHLKDMVEHFRVYAQPRRPEGQDEVWLAGERVDTRGDRLPSLRSLTHTYWSTGRIVFDSLIPHSSGTGCGYL